MKRDKISGRKLKNQIFSLLNEGDVEQHIKEILTLPARRVVNPLFSFFYSKDELIKWRAVTAMGAVVSDLANCDMESARVVMRRLMWNLNDESGGIGWGSPEAMGEIMALNHRLAKEYSNILVSYIRPDGNFLEHPGLQQGILWGIGRLAHARPHFVQDTVQFFLPFLNSTDAVSRGLASWAVGAFDSELPKTLLCRLIDDIAEIKIFINAEPIECTVGQLARNSLSKRQIEAKR